MKQKLGLVFGGRSGEHEVSLQSARSIAAAVDRNRFDLFLIAIDKSGDWYLANEDYYLNQPDDPSRISLAVKADQRVAWIPGKGSNVLLDLKSGKEIVSLDAIFPIIHGTFGEDGALQGYAAMLNTPCVGADVLGSSIGMDKTIAKELLIRAGIPVAGYLMADKHTNHGSLFGEVESRFTYPVFVKPSCSGSSVGVYKATSRNELKNAVEKALQYDFRILVEEAIEGREIECAILGNDELLASVPGEIVPRHAFYSYEAKYIDEQGARLDMPADLDDPARIKVQEMAVKAYKALYCSGMARVDMFLTKSGKLILNEINTLPGFTRISMYPKLMELTGVTFTDLIGRLVDLAIEKHTEKEKHLSNVLAAGSY